MRVLVKKTRANSNAGAAEHSEDLSAVIVEAETQNFEAEAAPNKSMMELQTLLKLFPVSTERMIVAPVGAITHSPHGGMVVQLDGKMHQCSCVLTFIAHTGKSQVAALANGHRIVSKEIWNIPFRGAAEQAGGSAADKKAAGEFASFCTMDNVQYYSLSPTCGKEPVYAIVLISNAFETDAKTMYMIDKVAKIADKSLRSEVIQHFKKLAWPLGESEGKESRRRARTFSASPQVTPYTVRETRRSSASPTDGSLPDGDSQLTDGQLTA